MNYATRFFSWLLILLLAISFACSPEIITTPNGDSTEQEPDDGDTPDTPNDPTEGEEGSEDNEGGEDNEGAQTVPDGVSRPEPYYGVEAWSGTTANDAESDVVGTNADFFHELNTFSNIVVVAYDGATATITSNNSKIASYVDGAYVALDMATNGVGGVEIIVVGATKDGGLKIYSDNKFKLSLYGVDITSQRGPAINSQSKKRMFVDLYRGTTNRLTDSATYQDDIFTMPGVYNEDRKGALFAEGNIILSGEGALVVAGNERHAIVTDGCFYQRPGVTTVVADTQKNALQVKGDSDDGTGAVIAGGAFVANVSSAAGKGIKSDSDVCIESGIVEVTTSGDAYYDSEEGDTSSAAGIKADYNIIIDGGSLSLSSSGTGGKGLNADGGIEINGGAIAVATSGTRYTYSSSLTSSPKGIKADGDITISGGVINISVTGRGEGSEGMESKSSIVFNGGETIIEAYDDAINATSAITVNDGRIYAYSSNNDGIDSNGTMTINGGLVIGVGGNAPEAGIDIDNSNNFRVNGGIAIGYGAALQSTPSTSSAQCSVAYGGVSGSEGAMVALLNASSKPIFGFECPRTISNATLFLSSPEIVKGESYSISSGGTLSNYSDMWQVWYDGGVWSSGSTLTSFTISSVVTTIGSTGGGTGGGSRPR